MEQPAAEREPGTATLEEETDEPGVEDERQNEEQGGPDGVAERAVVVMKPGNAGGAKGPWSVTGAGRGERGGD